MKTKIDAELYPVAPHTAKDVLLRLEKYGAYAIGANFSVDNGYVEFSVQWYSEDGEFCTANEGDVLLFVGGKVVVTGAEYFRSHPDEKDGGVVLMDIAEFVEFGYLQEVNRRFFHPLGLMLVVSRDSDGHVSLLGIGKTDDPEGMKFADGVLSSVKCQRVTRKQITMMKTRYEKLGFMIQPCET